MASPFATHERSRVSLLASRYGPSSWRLRGSRRRLEYRPSFSRLAASACIARSGRLANFQQATRRARPNPSLKRRANSAPPGPRGATSFILHRAGLPSRCWLPLSSNVRPHRTEISDRLLSCELQSAGCRSGRNSARKGRSKIHSALSNTVLCERCEFSRRNLEVLVRGASRRALRRIVCQLSRPRAANGKAAAVRLPRRV